MSTDREALQRVQQNCTAMLAEIERLRALLAAPPQAAQPRELSDEEIRSLWQLGWVWDGDQWVLPGQQAAPTESDMSVWQENRTAILDAIEKAGFKLMSNAQGFWLHPQAAQPRELSDEEIRSLWQHIEAEDAEDEILNFARAVLAASKEIK